MSELYKKFLATTNGVAMAAQNEGPVRCATSIEEARAYPTAYAQTLAKCANPAYFVYRPLKDIAAEFERSDDPAIRELVSQYRPAQPGERFLPKEERAFLKTQGFAAYLLGGVWYQVHVSELVTPEDMQIWQIEWDDHQRRIRLAHVETRRASFGLPTALPAQGSTMLGTI